MHALARNIFLFYVTQHITVCQGVSRDLGYFLCQDWLKKYNFYLFNTSAESPAGFSLI